jgi:hypothetical protein
MTKRPLRERFDEKYILEPDTGCWLWTRSTSASGYGRISVNGKPRKAHRASYEIHIGPIPDGLCVLHRCDTPACVNPEHLFLGTQQDNMADMNRKGRGARGERNGGTHLTERDILAIRADKRLHRLIAADYGVAGSQISVIKNRKTWRHVQ